METLFRTRAKVLSDDKYNSVILSEQALDFLQALHEKFNSKRKSLILERSQRQHEIDKGVMPYFLPETKNVREGDWKVAPIPHD